jgi:hypothetical protein
MIRGELAIAAHLFSPQTSHEGGTVKAPPLSMWRGNLDRKPYCLIGECPRDVERCLSKRAPLPHWSSGLATAPFLFH